METTQLLVVITLGFVSLLTIIIGIQIILLLGDIRKISKHIKVIFSNLETIGINTKDSYEEISGFVQAIKSFLTISEKLSHDKNEKRK